MIPPERKVFAKRKDLVEMPNLIEIQTKSFYDFLQMDVLPEKRQNQGLQSVFQEVFPIASYDGTSTLEFLNYNISPSKYDALECQRRGLTYAGTLKVSLRLHEQKNVKEETVYMGAIPMMTERGTFIVNGAERVIVSQLHRSPGICFEKVQNPRGGALESCRIIPYRGTWLELQFDSNEFVYIYVEKRRRRKILATTFLKALGYGVNRDIIGLFFNIEKIALDKRLSEKDIVGKILAGSIIDPNTKTEIIKTPVKITKPILKSLEDAGVKELEVLAESITEENPIIKMLMKDPVNNEEEALKDIYKKLRPGDPFTVQNAKTLLKRLLFDPRRYDLGKVGRYKLNKRLGIESTEKELEVTSLRKRDILECCKKLLQMHEGIIKQDDIDHLGNRRVRLVGELVTNVCRVGLSRMERLVKERMNLFDMATEVMTASKLINPKVFANTIKDFFGRSQLSQFMDQTNPVAELTHKRRLSALGPGGLSRERAGFEVRDVHTSHYGRVCPIETPEGPNIGLIASLSMYAKINEFGFIETPYRKVIECKITKEVKYLTADEEENYVIAQANAKIDEKGILVDQEVSCRFKGDTLKVAPEKVEFIDVSPKQLVSVAAGLIPFLEHDDANRALMGSNMMRQAVPLVYPESPLVATGVESKSARDSGIMVISENDGEVISVDSNSITIGEKVYPLMKFLRSNAGTSVNQRPLVKLGEKITKGQIIADGPATKDGELALGKNVLAAFMPWSGYNFEDAIVVSERLLKKDTYTSIHIEEFEITARETKLGKEEITRDIPNVGEEALKNLGEDGIVRVGAEVVPGDILVGKITPKSETELSPEERLLRAIFGEKAADVRDASLTVPSGIAGLVVDVHVFARKEGSKTENDKSFERKEVRRINSEYRDNVNVLNEKRRHDVEELLLNKKLPVDLLQQPAGKVIIPAGEKITDKHIAKLEAINYESLEMEECEERLAVKKLIKHYDWLNEELNIRKDVELEQVKKGDELEPGVLKQVKVYVATKKKLSVGDKMAGRHGNKGVIAKIVPEEDMPYLPDGRPVDVVLNPLGVPSRMNVGQVLETHLGWAAKALGFKVVSPVFDGLSEQEIIDLMKKANLPGDGKTELFDGRTGEKFDQKVVVGYIYIMKLSHLVSDKIHARAVGPYSLITQQPLGGKAQFGGQRFGEMEVWALEAYGAASVLQEMLTVKSDDIAGRTRIYESIVKGQNTLQAGTPESFNVLMKELQGLCLNMAVEKEKI
jgi:DNA-directed RNA polymerase subunit beta